MLAGVGRLLSRIARVYQGSAWPYPQSPLRLFSQAHGRLDRGLWIPLARNLPSANRKPFAEPERTQPAALRPPKDGKMMD